MKIVAEIRDSNCFSARIDLVYSLHEALGVRRVDALLGHVSQSVGDWLLVLAALPPERMRYSDLPFS